MDKKEIIKITDDVTWIGVQDPDLKTFDIVMETQYGTTYNSYFIRAEKKTVIDTSKEIFKDVYIGKVLQMGNPHEIEYIVMNHTEPDHSGNLKHLLSIARNATVIGSGNAIRYLQDMTGKLFKNRIVKDGDVLDLGNKKLRIIGAPNLHWPDSIYTYLEEDRLLFSCDSFGAHFCHDGVFDDTAGNYDDAFRYYFDVILKPFSKFMLKAIEKIRPLPIRMICPGHGPVLRSDWKKFVDFSEQYSTDYLAQNTHERKRILIAYVSAYGYTREAAYFIAEGMKQKKLIEVDLLDLEKTEAGEMESRLVLCDGLLVGSPTFNQNILLPVYKLFSVINPIRDKGKLASAFGSYGWSGEGVNIIADTLKNLKFSLAVVPLAIKFRPDEEKKQQLIGFGKMFSEKVLVG